MDPRAALAGTGLVTHLRSNLTLSVPFPDCGRGGQWGVAALAVRGVHREPGRRQTRFHHQVTAYGIRTADAESARALLDSTPRADIESLDPAMRSPAQHLIITVASAAEMAGDPRGTVSLLDERDEFGTRRAYVKLSAGPADARTWDTMDRSAVGVAEVLAAGTPYKLLRPRRLARHGDAHPAGASPTEESREPLGCGHHEMGTLRMGEDPQDSVADPDCRIRALSNLYIAGPAMFPGLDSVGPVLPGIALTLRLGEHLLQAHHRKGELKCNGLP